MAVDSSVPELKTEVLIVTFLPRFLAKKPLAMPTRAGSWVMLAWNPSRSTTGAEPEPEPEEPAADDEQPAPRRVTPATPAASSARLIKILPFPILLLSRSR